MNFPQIPHKFLWALGAIPTSTPPNPCKVPGWKLRNFKTAKRFFFLIFFLFPAGRFGVFLAPGAGEVEQNIFRAAGNAATQAGLFICTLLVESANK